MLGGFVYIFAFVATYLIYFVFAEQTEDNFFGQHAFIHTIDVLTFAMLALGALGVYLSQSERLGRIAKAGFWLTLAGFGLSVAGGLTIIVVGLTVSDEATLGVLDAITHPLAQLLYTLGSLIFGVSLLRKGTLPKPAALLATVEARGALRAVRARPQPVVRTHHGGRGRHGPGLGVARLRAPLRAAEERRPPAATCRAIRAELR